MKYGIYFFAFCFGICVYLAYRAGDAACRTSVAQATANQEHHNRTIGQQIEHRVLAVPDADNLDWLLREYTRAN